MVLDMLEGFEEYHIIIIPGSQNSIANTYGVDASTFRIPINPNTKYTIEVKHRPAIPDNVKYWQVFEDDDHIESFLTLTDEFENMVIDEEEEGIKIEELPSEENQSHGDHLTHIRDKEIIQLKNNSFPKGLVPLEGMFDQNDVAKTLGVAPTETWVEDFNIGTTDDPKFNKISKNLPQKARGEYLALLKKYSKVFAWKYEDLKVYDTSVIQHTIPIKEDAKPCRKKLRRINPLLLPLIENEVNKLFEAKIILVLRHSRWLANVVLVRKKNGEIKICIDFRNLNRVSLKDNYPVPKMDHILQKVVGSQRMSMLDGFYGYNQVLVHPDDQENTAFTTPWGTFMYSKIPFDLMNAGATFQRAMDIAFSEEKDKFVVLYLDHIVVFSKSDEKHLQHLERIFLKCMKFGIFLNPKKSHFDLEEGKLLWHIISKDGFRIDPGRVEAIGHVAFPRSKKEVQLFISKVNFLRRFIINCAEKMTSITKMIRKRNEIKWTPEARQSFSEIKIALT